MITLHAPLYRGIGQALVDIFVSGYYADKVLEYHFKRHREWGAKDRRLIAQVVYDMTRWWRRLQWALQENEDNEVSEHFIEKAIHLWCALEGITVKGQDPARFPVDSAVKRWKDAKERAIVYSIPAWLDSIGSEQLGAKWPEILEASNAKAPVFLRANTLKTTVQDLQKKLSALEIKTVTLPDFPDALKLTEKQNVFSTPLFKEGLFEVQDIGSQRISEFFDPKPGDRVVDACAGAGGKTLHCAMKMKNKGKIIALDIHERKITELKKRCSRAGVDIVEARLIDNQKVIKRLADSCDHLLLDVPCSGTGVLRRNPDSKWKLKEERLAELIEIQKEILQSYSAMVKKNGVMVYATCSVLPAENENQIRDFLSRNETQKNGQWKLVDQWSLLPQVEGHDGFFAAKLIRI